MEFRAEIEKRLNGLDHEQILRFGWLCAVRALPFFSADNRCRGFTCCEEDGRQTFLYSVLIIPDLCSHRVKDFDNAGIRADDTHANDDANDPSTWVAAIVANAKAACADIDYIISETADLLPAATADDANAIINACAAVVFHVLASLTAVKASEAYLARAAAVHTHVTIFAPIIGDFDPYANAYALTYAAAHLTFAFAKAQVTEAATYVAVASNKTGKSLEQILFDDLEAIKTNNPTSLNNDIRIYGEIWPHFIKDLIDVGCGYWARLYQDLFKNRFVVDEKELERRFKVPDEIREKGAAAVGRYLDETAKAGNDYYIMPLFFTKDNQLNQPPHDKENQSSTTKSTEEIISQLLPIIKGVQEVTNIEHQNNYYGNTTTGDQSPITVGDVGKIDYSHKVTQLPTEEHFSQTLKELKEFLESEQVKVFRPEILQETRIYITLADKYGPEEGCKYLRNILDTVGSIASIFSFFLAVTPGAPEAVRALISSLLPPVLGTMYTTQTMQ